jgi:hypothetical protein
MWIWLKDYVAMRERIARQETTITLLQHQLNFLFRDNAVLKSKQLGIPELVVPQIEVGDPTAPTPIVLPEPKRPSRVPAEDEGGPTAEDIFRGNIDMEDMGDDRAAKEGVGWDPVTGTVAYGQKA